MHKYWRSVKDNAIISYKYSKKVEECKDAMYSVRCYAAWK
jgi:hypothetical protein